MVGWLPFQGYRPPRDEWAPVSNAGDSDDRAAFKIAAEKIGVEIKFAHPTPCPAGADYCARLGMKGVYIRRSQVDRKDELVRAKHDAFSAMSK